MKKISILAALAVAILLTCNGCVKTQAGAFKRTGVFANLEFDEATSDIYETDTTGRTNHFEHWQVKGLKSDTQKALETLNKGLDLAKEALTKAP